MARIETGDGQVGDDPFRRQPLHPCAPMRAGAAGRLQGECRRTLDRSGRGESRRADAGRDQLPLRRHPRYPPRRRRAGGQPEGQHHHDPRERAARGLRGDRARRRADRNARDALPLRRVEEQALLRRLARRRGISSAPASRRPPTSAPLAKRDGVVDVTPYPNGPLGVAGPVEILTGTGRTIDRIAGTALCRCGHSANKPYCDGSHARVGFVAP